MAAGRLRTSAGLANGDGLGVDIYDIRWVVEGESKAKRLRYHLLPEHGGSGMSQRE